MKKFVLLFLFSLLLSSCGVSQKFVDDIYYKPTNSINVGTTKHSIPPPFIPTIRLNLTPSYSCFYLYNHNYQNWGFSYSRNNRLFFYNYWGFGGYNPYFPHWSPYWYLYHPNWKFGYYTFHQRHLFFNWYHNPYRYVYFHHHPINKKPDTYVRKPRTSIGGTTLGGETDNSNRYRRPETVNRVYQERNINRNEGVVREVQVPQINRNVIETSGVRTRRTPESVNQRRTSPAIPSERSNVTPQTRRTTPPARITPPQQPTRRTPPPRTTSGSGVRRVSSDGRSN